MRLSPRVPATLTPATPWSPALTCNATTTAHSLFTSTRPFPTIRRTLTKQAARREMPAHTDGKGQRHAWREIPTSRKRIPRARRGTPTCSETGTDKRGDQRRHAKKGVPACPTEDTYMLGEGHRHGRESTSHPRKRTTTCIEKAPIIREAGTDMVSVR